MAFGGVMLATNVTSSTVTVAWDRSPGTNVVGYNFYYGTNSASMTNKLNVGNQASAKLTGFVPQTTYNFTVTAYDAAGVESQPSNVIQYTAPALALPALKASLAVGTSKSVQLNFQATAGVNYRIEATEDLKTWTTVLTTNLSAGGSINLKMMDLSSYKKRFYRIAQN